MNRWRWFDGHTGRRNVSHACSRAHTGPFAGAQKNVGRPAYWVYNVMPITAMEKGETPGVMDDTFAGETYGQGLALREVIGV